MTSSKFAHRKRTPVAPHICHPPPPPPPWPPNGVWVAFIIFWVDPYGFHKVNWFQSWPQTAPNQYLGERHLPDEDTYGEWVLKPSTETAMLHINGQKAGFGFHATKNNLPLTWGTKNEYTIFPGDWDDIYPYNATAACGVTF